MESATVQQEVEFVHRSLAHMREDIDKIEGTLIAFNGSAHSSGKAEFASKYPSIQEDEGLFSLLGTQPATSLEQEKKLLQDELRKRYAS